ncbi:sensor histidine kinase [Bradyrhizobium diazoefficiens]|uniref:sensor histidine kinase n=1 Tax=Bradyrhizobium diazoefficiens TaxID=1355477 RepID=UPI001909718B|nr:sensor histidine kinase [Bradyrhizobium diazoefficiens]QQO37205.1 sensor histidine kinase [Bradyrhizobium diazoefficiens]
MAGRWLAAAWLFLAAVVATAISAAAADGASPELKRIVIFNSYGQNFKPWRDYSTALRQELERQSRWPIDIQDFSVATARFEDRNVEAEFADYLRALFARGAPDLIVALGGPAAMFVQRNRQQLFPSTPMVMTAVEERRVQRSALTDKDAVVAVKQDVPALFGNIVRLLPATRMIAVVVGDSPNERFWQSEIGKELEPVLPNVRLLFWNRLSFPDILKEAARLPPDSAIFWAPLQVDATGASHEGEQALRELHAVANAPIFSYDEAFFGGETVGGPMTSAFDSARKTSRAVVRILGGERPSDIKIPTLEYGPAKYDWRQLRRWSIAESGLPPGSEVYFRDPSPWETYRWQILLIASVILVQAALISILVHERRGRLKAEVQARRQSAELAHVNRYTMAGELTASIAHELNQPLGAILTNAESAALMLRSPNPDLNELNEIIEDIRRDDARASEVIVHLRSLLKKAPFEEKELDLNDVLEETVTFLAPLATARKVELDAVTHLTLLPIKGDRIQLQQVITNLVVNAMDAVTGSAGNVRKVDIEAVRAGNRAEVSIRDYGPGIPVDQLKRVFEPFFTTKPEGMGMGLAIARTIVEAHNGRITAENQSGGGAQLRISLPLSTA